MNPVPQTDLPLWAWAWLVLKASLLSTSGVGNIPSLYSDLVLTGQATDAQFAEAFAIGQITPGPGGLWVVSLGVLLGGVPGALIALVMICLPPLLVLVLRRLHERVQDNPLVNGFLRGLSAAVAGVSLVTLVRLLLSVGVSPSTVCIALAALGLSLTGRVPILVIFALAAVAGVVLR